MDYTSNCHLPQWVKNDRIMMDDFNSAMSSIDSNIAAAKSAAAAAQSTANSAKSSAATAQSTANKALSSLPYAAGTYIGCSTEVIVNLGFRPRFVIVNGTKGSDDTTGVKPFNRYACLTAGNIPLSTIKFTDTGFTILFPSEVACPMLSDKGRVYDYIAFK